MKQPLGTLSFLILSTLVCVSSGYVAPAAETATNKDSRYAPPGAANTVTKIQTGTAKVDGAGLPLETVEAVGSRIETTVTPIPQRVCSYVRFQGVTIDVTRWDPQTMNGQSDLFGSCPPGYRCMGQGKCEWQYGSAGANRVIYEGDPACTFSSQSCKPTLG